MPSVSVAGPRRLAPNPWPVGANFQCYNFRMEETFEYHGQKITVGTTATNLPSVRYAPRIVIMGAVQTLDPNGPFPPHQFPEEKNAIEYGKKAAEWIADNVANIGSVVEDEKEN